MLSFAFWTLVCIAIIVISYKLSKKPGIYRLGFLDGSLAVLYFNAPIAFTVTASLVSFVCILRLFELEKEKANAKS